MAPPQLARDAPVLNVLEPLVVNGLPLLRKDVDLAARDDIERDLRNRLARMQRPRRRRLAHRHVPLLGQHRLDHFAGALTARHRHLVRLFGNNQARRAQIGEYGLARDIAVHAAILCRRVVVDRRGQREYRYRFESMPLADREIVEVMRRRDLHRTGAEFHVDVVVSNHRNCATV